MEKFLATSKILYDHDLLDKTQEINNLKQTLKNINPTRKFNSENEWNDIRTQALSDFWLFLIQNIRYDDDDSQIRLNFAGCPVYGSPRIAQELEKTLFAISQCEVWSHTKSWDIMFTVNAHIEALIDIDDGEIIENMMDFQKAHFIFSMINNNLGNGFNGGILNGLPIFACSRCGDVTDFITKRSVFCFECSSIAEKITRLVRKIDSKAKFYYS
jgi:hypothetical protein